MRSFFKKFSKIGNVSIQNVNKDNLLITGGKALNESFLNHYVKIFSVDQLIYFEALYLELKPKCDAFRMKGPDFLNYLKDSHQRYQSNKKLDPFKPMDAKSQRYVEISIRRFLARKPM